MKLTRYREFDCFQPQPGVRLLAYETERFKTVRVRVFLLEPIREVVATENAILARTPRSATERYPSRREIARACEDLYGASVNVEVTRFGDAQAVIGTIEFPADRFLPKDAKELEGAISLLVEILTRPVLSKDGSAIRADLVDQEKFQLEQDLRAIQDDKPAWASLQATERTYAGTPGAISEGGRMADLPAVTPKGMLTRQRSLIGNAQVLAFVTGPVQPLHALKTLAEAMPLPVAKRVELLPAKKLKNRERPRAERVPSKAEQTHLLFTWSGGGVYGTPGFAPMLFADALFGGYGMSRLFKVVREEHGLAYAVHSNYHRARGSIVAQAAVDNARADQAVALIRSEFKRLQTSGFSDEEFSAVRESLIESRRSNWDSQGARVSDAVFQFVSGFQQTFDEQLDEIRNVKPRQVRAALKKLKPHSEFRLG